MKNQKELPIDPTSGTTSAAAAPEPAEKPPSGGSISKKNKYNSNMVSQIGGDDTVKQIQQNKDQLEKLINEIKNLDKGQDDTDDSSKTKRFILKILLKIKIQVMIQVMKKNPLQMKIFKHSHQKFAN